MFIVWYSLHGIPGYGMKFDNREDADWFIQWMSQFKSIYSDISIEER